MREHPRHRSFSEQWLTVLIICTDARDALCLWDETCPEARSLSEKTVIIRLTASREAKRGSLK